MDKREFPKIRKAAKRQGWVIRQTRDGEMFYSPDGTTKVAWHAAHGSSDPHALEAFVRQLKKGGFWLPPGKR